MSSKLSIYKYFVIAAVFALIIFPKFLYLDRIPVSLAHDEAIYAVNSISYQVRGTDLSGYGFPLSLFRSQTEGGITPLAPLIYSVVFKIFPLNQTSYRLLMVFVNLLTALILFLLTKEVTKKNQIAYISASLFLISPWSYFFSRWAVDTPWSLLFYLIGILLLLKTKDKKMLFFSLLFFVLGFFSYHGAKLTFLPIILVTSYYKISSLGGSDTHRERNYVKAIVILALIFFFAYLVIDFSLPNEKLAGRSKDLIVLNADRFAKDVDVARKNSIENSVNEIFLNKYIFMGETIAYKYFSAFSPNVLFLSGDLRSTYRFEYHGLLYLVEFVFILLGFAYYYANSRKVFCFLTLLVLIAPFATALSDLDTSIINRSFMLLPLFSVLSAGGIYFLIKSLEKFRYKNMFTILLFAVIALSYMRFLHFYFYRYPITGQENYFLTDKIIAKYLSYSESSNLNAVVVTSTPRTSYFESVFYLNYARQDLVNKLNKAEKVDEYSIGNNLQFTADCPDEIDSNTIYLISRESNCKESFQHESEIIDQKDAGKMYKIINDRICDGIEKDIYRRFHKVEDYTIMNLDKVSFCKKWINSAKI